MQILSYKTIIKNQKCAIFLNRFYDSIYRTLRLFFKSNHQKYKKRLTLLDFGGIIDDVIKQQQNFLQKQEQVVVSDRLHHLLSFCLWVLNQCTCM